MSVERTFSIIKPDGVKQNVIGPIITKFEENGLTVVGAQMRLLSKHEAEGFYAVHKERPFFGELVEFMMSGPVMLLVLQGEGAIAKNRELMGATDPAEADDGTIRKLYAASKGENTVHGSDAPETAATEIAWFFNEANVHAR